MHLLLLLFMLLLLLLFMLLLLLLFMPLLLFFSLRRLHPPPPSLCTGADAARGAVRSGHLPRLRHALPHHEDGDDSAATAGTRLPERGTVEYCYVTCRGVWGWAAHMHTLAHTDAVGQAAIHFEGSSSTWRHAFNICTLHLVDTAQSRSPLLPCPCLSPPLPCPALPCLTPAPPYPALPRPDRC